MENEPQVVRVRSGFPKPGEEFRDWSAEWTTIDWVTQRWLYANWFMRKVFGEPKPVKAKGRPFLSPDVGRVQLTDGSWADLTGAHEVVAWNTIGRIRNVCAVLQTVKGNLIFRYPRSAGLAGIVVGDNAEYARVDSMTNLIYNMVERGAGHLAKECFPEDYEEFVVRQKEADL